MKKSLLLGSALLVSIGAFAQANRMLVKPLTKNVASARIDHENTVPAGVIKPTAHNSVNVMSNTFTSSRNGFGMLVEETVPLSYDADLNMVAFTHRIAPAIGPYAWPTTGLPTTGVSGFMTTHYSTDNGATWAGVCHTNSGTAWSRYPSGVIANTPGNIDPAQAKFVGTGPATSGPGGWPFNWFASVPANSTGNITTNDQQFDSTAFTANSLCAGTYFSSYCTTNNGMDVWSGGYREDAAGNVDGVVIYKGVTTGGAYTWSRPLDAMLNQWFTSPAGKTYFSAPKIAFGPDHLTGYIVVNGVAANATGNTLTSYQPNVWKTTDGGATWNKVNENYDWKTNHPEITSNLLLSAFDHTWNGSMFGNQNYPAFWDAHGGEITVDANGVLHYVTTVIPAYSTHPDSLGTTRYSEYGFSYVQNDNVDKPYVFDFTTTGNGTWDARFITYLYTRNISTTEVVGTNAFWTTDGIASLDYTNRIKVSRTKDGTKIFMTWTDSDTTQTVPGPPISYIPNKLPSIFYKGLDVATNMVTPTKEAVYFDAVENAFYLYQTSEIVRPISGTLACAGTGYQIPTVYIRSSDGSQNATNAVDYNYIKDMEICDGTFTNALTLNQSPIAVPFWIVGTKEAKGTLISGVSQNYPNPFSGSTTINVNLNKSDVISLEVTNSLGQVVATKVVKGTAGSNEITIDAANFESGIYFYSVVAGNSKVTRKMSVVK